ncbi:MAG: folate-binding protein [Terriglobales bacterium]
MSSIAIHNQSTPAAADPGQVRAEFAELVSGCAVYDLRDRAKISLTGSDRVRWLNGMITNNVRDLAVGSGVYAFLLNPQGHILGDLYALNRGGSLLVDTGRSQVEKLLATFEHYIIMDDVEVVNLGEEMPSIGVSGPRAGAALRAAGFEFADLELLHFVETTWQNIPLTVLRNDNPSVESYELWLPRDRYTEVWDALTGSGFKTVGAAAVELLRIACGIPRYGQDIRERDLPQETEQQRALHFNKGCYIGQEIVERIRSRGNVHRKFSGFEVRGALPAPGTKIQVEGKDAGEVTSAASLPATDGDHGVALGYIRREMAIPGKEVQAGDIRLSVAPLPFTQYLGGQTAKD